MRRGTCEPATCKRSGTTIVEAMVAIMILGGTIGGACHLTVLAKRLCDQSREHYQAINIARNHLERVRVMGYDQLSRCGETSVRLDEQGVEDSNGRFRRSTAVTTVSADVKQVSVTVAVMNRISLAFDGGSEEISTLLTPFRTSIE